MSENSITITVEEAENAVDFLNILALFCERHESPEGMTEAVKSLAEAIHEKVISE